MFLSGLSDAWKTEVPDDIQKRVDEMGLVTRKPVFGVSDQVPHKPGCTTTEDG